MEPPLAEADAQGEDAQPRGCGAALDSPRPPERSRHRPGARSIARGRGAGGHRRARRDWLTPKESNSARRGCQRCSPLVHQDRTTGKSATSVRRVRLPSYRTPAAGGRSDSTPTPSSANDGMEIHRTMIAEGARTGSALGPLATPPYAAQCDSATKQCDWRGCGVIRWRSRAIRRKRNA